eukprot:142162_1
MDLIILYTWDYTSNIVGDDSETIELKHKFWTKQNLKDCITYIKDLDLLYYSVLVILCVVFECILWRVLQSILFAITGYHAEVVGRTEIVFVAESACSRCK